MKKIKLDQLPKNASAPTVPTAKPKGSAHTFGQVGKIITAVLMLAYILLPTDLLPDLVPVIGWLDDAVAAVGMIASAVSAIKNRRYDPESRMEERAKDVFGEDNF